MKTLSCKQVSGLNCDYLATGSTTEEVKRQLYNHGMTVHPEMMAKLSEDDKKNLDKKMDEMAG